jgi:enoyl-CoA hydratase/carnithine racemase
MTDPIHTQQHGEILEIILNRPEVLNAFNPEVMMALSDSDRAHNAPGNRACPLRSNADVDKAR